MPTLTTVNISELGPGEPSKYKDANDDGLSIFVDYEIRSHYEKDRHIYMLGIASPSGFNGQSTAFVQLAAPTLLWIVDWTAARFFRQPDVPDPEPVDSNWVLMDDFWEPCNPVYGPDGFTPLYRISGTYVYGCKNPNDKTHKNVTFPLPPFLKNDFQFGLDIPDSALKKEIIFPDNSGGLEGGVTTNQTPPFINAGPKTGP